MPRLKMSTDFISEIWSSSSRNAIYSSFSGSDSLESYSEHSRSRNLNMCCHTGNPQIDSKLCATDCNLFLFDAFGIMTVLLDVRNVRMMITKNDDTGFQLSIIVDLQVSENIQITTDRCCTLQW